MDYHSWPGWIRWFSSSIWPACFSCHPWIPFAEISSTKFTKSALFGNAIAYCCNQYSRFVAECIVAHGQSTGCLPAPYSGNPSHCGYARKIKLFRLWPTIGRDQRQYHIGKKTSRILDSEKPMSCGLSHCSSDDQSPGQIRGCSFRLLYQ